MALTNRGPHVQVAAFVEKWIRGAESGAISLINILDTATFAGPESDEMPSFSLEPLNLVLALWAGQTKGRYNVLVRPEAPSGIQGDPIKVGSVNFANTGAIGVNLITKIPYEITEEGVYWFDILLDRKDQEPQVVTRVPLTVAYQPA